MAIVDDIREQRLSPQEVMQLVTSSGKISPAERQQIIDYASEQALVDERWNRVVESLDGSLETGELTRDQQQLAEQVVMNIVMARESGRPITLEDVVDQAPPELALSEREAWAKRVLDEATKKYEKARTQELQAEGVDADVAARQAKQETVTATSLRGNTPRWILDEVGLLTDAQKERILQYWNDLYGTNFRNFDEELAPLLEDRTATNQQIIQAGLLAQEPTMAFTISIPGVARPQVMTAEQVKTLQDVYGLDNSSITRIVRLTSMMDGGKNDLGEVNFQPVVAILAANGKLRNLADPDQVVGEQPGIRAARDAAARVAEERANDPVSRFTDQVREFFGFGAKTPRRSEAELLQELDVGMEIVEENTFNVQATLKKYNEGLERYNHNPTLAFLYALDEGLAERIAQSGGDPAKLTGSDNARAMELLQRGGLVNRGNTPWAQIGGARDDFVLAQLSDYFRSYGPDAGEEKPKRQLPDPVAIAQNFRDLYRSLMFAEPSQQLIEAFMDDLNRTLATVPIEQTIDATARMQEFIRSTPGYRELYQHRGGLGEGEYQNIFRAGVSSILGADANEEAILAGMRTGEYQTSVGAAAMSKQAQDNSTWQGRLARVAEVVARNT